VKAAIVMVVVVVGMIGSSYVVLLCDVEENGRN
jgi:hypothetical protein